MTRSSSRNGPFRDRQALSATLFYVAVTLAFTWPFVTVMHREIAADMGDPVFICWVLLWTSGQVFSFLTGDFTALSRYWNGNIFYPEPLTLAYSEHFTAQMIQALPVLTFTDNIVLVYNLLFFSTFVLSGLGAFLLVRDLTGKPLAALLAGLAFAFAPYRVDQFPHLQVLSAQWMPFALWGLRRYLETGRHRALVGGATALVAQNLSCGYYVMYFTPFAAAYVVYELWSRGRLRDWATWRSLAIAGIVVAVFTLPFLTPYLEVRKSGVGVRGTGEIALFSADAHAFATSTARSWLWGERMAAFPRAEGQAFPGLAILSMAIVGIAGALVSWRRRPRPASTPWRQMLTGVLAVLFAASLYASVTLLVTGGFVVPWIGANSQWHQGGQVFLVLVLSALGLTLLFRRSSDAQAPGRSPELFFALAALAAAVLAMGPQITVRGNPVSPAPYALFMNYVPGFDGLRVPSRFMMVAALGLAVLAGLGSARLIERLRGTGRALVLLCGALILLEAWPSAFETNVRIGAVGLELTPRELRTGDNIAPIYKAIRDNPRPLVLLELPLGAMPWDLHAIFYSGFHRQRLVNGYSGFFPESYQRLARILNARREDPDATWRALLASGATHVLVHEAAYPPHRRAEIGEWLLANGAREVFTGGSDRLFSVR